MAAGKLKHAGYKPRFVDPAVEQALDTFGGAVIRGPKFCGKTWTGQSHANSEATLMATEANPRPLETYAAAPSLALRGESPHLIDEWQELPLLWDMVRSAIDQSGKRRSFILTGSSTPRASRPDHSGVGRIARIDMRTMSLAESGVSSCEVSMRELFASPGGAVEGAAPACAPEEVAELVVRGGWPAVTEAPVSGARALAAGYVESFLDEDMNKVDGQARDRGKMARLLHSLARNAEQAATPKTMIRDMTADAANPPLAAETLDDYLDVLKRAFLVEEITNWSPNVRSAMRINKKPKYHFADPSLPAAILGVSPESLLGDFETFGFLFESMCVRDLLVYSQAMGAKLFSYRDRDDLEVDAVVEAPDGRWAGFEVKLGHNQADKAAANLLRLERKIAAAGGDRPACLAVVEGLGNYAYTRPDGVHVIPIQTLTA